MEILIRRKPATDGAILSEVFVDGVFQMFSVERPAVAIAAGRYPVRLTKSARAEAGTLWTPDPGHRLPLIEDVAGRSGLRFHAGNKAEQSDGCVLVGYELGAAVVGHSRQALVDLMAGMDRAEKADEPIFVEIEAAPAPGAETRLA